MLLWLLQERPAPSRTGQASSCRTRIGKLEAYRFDGHDRDKLALNPYARLSALLSKSHSGPAGSRGSRQQCRDAAQTAIRASRGDLERGARPIARLYTPVGAEP